MSAAADMKAIRVKIAERFGELHLGLVLEVKRSIQEGSTLTGAPGQPVAPKDGGNLIGSWQDTHPETFRSLVATNVEYAPSIEEGQQPPYTTASGKLVTPRPMQFRSEVGGAHSVALTRAGWDRIVEKVRRDVVGA